MVLLEEAEKERIEEINGDVVEGTWGRQVRNYVLAPQERVKDVRSGYETGNAKGILDGDLEDIVASNVGVKMK